MYKAIITYDGTLYFGWQKTKMGPSIQEELQKAIFQITQQEPLIEAASRTDRGVHAKGQTVQFALNETIDPVRLKKALNAVLPKDIRILHLFLHHFHPTLDATGKEYHYKISLGRVQDPWERLYAWHCYFPLNFSKIAEATKLFVKTGDFSAFANEKEKNPICTIHSVEFDGSQFKIRGNRFLYKMARNIVGTLVHVGCGKIAIDAIAEIFDSRDRKKGGITAPAHGLYLHQVFYPVN